MTCCRCNRTGHCHNCSCVKRGQPCLGCLLQRLGNCANTARTQPAPSASEDMAPQPSPTPNRKVSETAQTPVTDTPITTRETSTIFHTASPEADNPVSLSNTSLTCAPENVPELPQFTAMADPVFTQWGECDSVCFVNKLNAAYKEAVHWRPNLFKVPYGKAG